EVVARDLRFEIFGVLPRYPNERLALVVLMEFALADDHASVFAAELQRALLTVRRQAASRAYWKIAVLVPAALHCGLRHSSTQVQRKNFRAMHGSYPALIGLCSVDPRRSPEAPTWTTFLPNNGAVRCLASAARIANPSIESGARPTASATAFVCT